MVNIKSKIWRVTVVVALCLVTMASPLAAGSSLVTSPDEQWASPTQTSIKLLGNVDVTALDAGAEGNLDCTPLGYRLLDDAGGTNLSGCFVSTAFGLYDPNQNVAIFNGSSEGEPVHMSTGSEALSPLPYSASVASFSGFPVNGSYLHIYDYFPGKLSERRDGNFRRYQQLSGATDMTFNGTDGQPIPVNPQAYAYSARGQWMVIESPEHALLRVSLADFSVLPFADSFDVSGEPYKTHEAQLAISEDGRYVAVASSEFTYLKVYDLKNCGPEGGQLASRHCASYDYWPTVKVQVPALQSIIHVRFLNDGVLSFDAGKGSDLHSYELAPAGSITSLINYLALGDSYASGEGAGDYVAGTDTGSNSCHISAHSYPLRLLGDSFSGSGHSVACSGARIEDIANGSNAYTGQTKDQRSVASRQIDGSADNVLSDFLPGYLAQQAFVRQYQPGVITVGAGGDDIGFRDIMIDCISPLASLDPLKTNGNTCYNTYEDRLELEQTIDRTYQKWVAMYRQLQQQSPASRIYAVGYPQIAHGDQCHLNVRLNTAEIQFSEDLVNYLNSVIAKAAAAAGAQYVDVSQAFVGYRLCETANGQQAMNGLTAGHDAYDAFGKESYHPTAFGQELLEQAVLRATHNFSVVVDSHSASTLAGPTPQPDDALLNAPKSGRNTSAVIPDDQMAPDSVSRGGNLTIRIVGQDDGLVPGGIYTVSLGGTVLGSLQSDGQGNISGTLSLPGDSASGTQTITITGQGQSGQSEVVTKIIYVTHDDSDYDGDGLTNDQDSCPWVVNSGVDTDHDGLDDACDQVIGSTSASSGNSNQPSGDNGVGTTGSTDSQPAGSLTAGTVASDAHKTTDDPVIGSVQPAQSRFETIQARPATPSSGARLRVNPPGINSSIKVGMARPATLGRGSVIKQSSVTKEMYSRLPDIPWHWLVLAVIGLAAVTKLLRPTGRRLRPCLQRTLWLLISRV